MKQLIEITRKLVAFKTVSEDQQAIEACFSYIEQELKDAPLILKRYCKNGVSSRVWLTEDTLEPEILLCAHLDVVPASEKLFILKEDNGKLTGRGVSDMKFAIASFIVALKKLAEDKKIPKSLGIIITSDEENGGVNGVGYLVDEVGYKPKVVIIPDGGDNWKIVTQAKGVLQLKLIVKGKSAHASMPWEGDSAIDKLASVCSKIRSRFPIPKKEVWKITVNFGKISGGLKANQVSDRAELVLDIRYIPEDSAEHIQKEIESLSEKCIVEKIVQANPFSTPIENPYIKKWEQLILSNMSERNVFCREHGASDGRFFSQDTAVILSKPNGGGIHTEHEWLDTSSLLQFTNLLITFIKSL